MDQMKAFIPALQELHMNAQQQEANPTFQQSIYPQHLALAQILAMQQANKDAVQQNVDKTAQSATQPFNNFYMGIQPNQDH